MTEQVEIRCPSNFKRLFFKLSLSGANPIYVEGNWMEIACGDCLREQRNEELRIDGHTTLLRVFHYYSFLGELVKTKIVRVGEASDS